MSKNDAKLSSDDYEFQLLVAEEELILHAQMAIEGMLKERGMNQKQLAEKLGRSESYVSQMLGLTPRNLTLRTIARVMMALDAKATLMPDREAMENDMLQVTDDDGLFASASEGASAFASRIAATSLTCVWNEDKARPKTRRAKEHGNDDAKAYAAFDPQIQEMALAA